MKKAILSMVIVAVGLLSGCSSEESVSRPETIGQTGTLTFSFPSPRRSVTYAEDDSDPLVATEDEAAINDVTVYMFRSSGDMLLVARKSASPAEVEGKTVTFDVNNFTSIGGNYTFYAVANVSGNITDNFVVSQTTLDDFTSAVATATGTAPVQGRNMLMVGYTPINDLSTTTEPAQTITLRHRVARFDIVNVADDGDSDNNNDPASGETFFEITKIHVTNTSSAGYLTNEPDDRPDLADKVSLRGDDAIDVSGVTGINEGLARGAFYLWPGKLDGRDNLTGESTLIEVEGIYIGDSKPVVYKVLLAGDRSIEANKRYVLTVSRIDRTNLVFALEVSQWDNEEEEMRAVPSVDAVEYIDFSLNSTVLPDEEAIDINLSDNTGDSELRFSTLSENRATDELTATLDFTLGTDYAKNNFTPVVEGDPVVTYGGAKVRQTYKIILPKTTYPVAGTLTVEDVATTKKQIFNITSIPKYENTDYKPVLVRGKYSGQEEGEDEDRYWAPVNVGATSTTYSVNLAGCGYVFQWGRNVPFVYGSSNDTYDGPVYPETPVEDYANKFIATNQADWLQLEEDEEDDRWQGANAQGPCPDGWRVPTGTELTVLKSNISSAVTNNRVSVTGVGATLFLPAAGSRNNSGGWINQGAYGQYWSSSISGTNATRMYFNGSSSIINTYGRAFGFSVRCIQK